MRAIWSGSISFGLVNIPVKLYSASEERALSFDYLHKEDFSHIRYAKVCQREGREVDYSEVVRGYELPDGNYVILEEEDFEKANIKKVKSIEIINFSNQDEIDSKYYEKPYYLEPDKGAEKPYALLLEALKKSKKVGIAKFVMRTKEKLAALKPEENIFVLNQLRFKEEVRSSNELKKPTENISISGNELKIALELIDKLTEKFDPNKYTDTYSKELKEIIAEKASGKIPIPKGEIPTPTEVEDLMAMLKKSLEQEKVKSR